MSETMIPRAMKDKLHKIFYARKILSNQPIYKDIMALIAPEHIDPRSWLYGRNGEGKLVSNVEGVEMLASGDYADHPHGPVVDIDEDGGEIRNKEAWESGEKAELLETPVPLTVDPPVEIDKMVVGRDENGVMTNPTKDTHTRDELVAIAVGLGLDPLDKDNKKDIIKLIDENS